MRFAFAGIDFLGGVFDALVAAGWEPVKLFTRPCDGVYDHNEAIVAGARRRRIPVQLSRILPDDVAALSERHGRDTVLVVAGYPWLVTGWRPHLARALNVHPSPLPTGRGPYPLFRAILEGREAWAVTAHVLAEEGFDTGDVLAAEPFALSPAETHETLLAKCQMAAARLARERIGPDLPQLWRAARPQDEGSYWPRASDADRTLDFRADVEDVLRRVRAFGSIETVATVEGRRLYVAEAAGWREPHRHAPGAVVQRHQRRIVVAARDGYVLLTRWSSLPPGTGEAGRLGR